MGSIFSKPKAPAAPAPVKLPEYVPPPDPEPVVEAPSEVVDEDAIAKKKAKEQQAQQQRSGRASTFLTDSGDGALG